MATVSMESLGEGAEKLFNDDELYTPIEVANRLKVTKEAVYNWVKRNKLKSVRFGRVVRIKGSELNKLIEVD